MVVICREGDARGFGVIWCRPRGSHSAQVGNDVLLVGVRERTGARSDAS
jgi:hypothetical protein